jgi:hypothetical protein
MILKLPVLLTSALLLAATAQGQTTASPPVPVAVRTVKVLPPDVSRNLKLTRMPTTHTVPLIVGHYWSCHDSGYGTDLCRLVMVVCTNDQSTCFEL